MAHESFEDEVAADLLNKYFVSIKVDREERPDIDNTYMRVCQAFNGGGGWPMSKFLTADKKPFFAGTYFPKDRFISLMESIRRGWPGIKAEALKKSEEIIAALAGAAREGAVAEAPVADDGAMPSGNSVMAYNLSRLFILTGFGRYYDLLKNSASLRTPKLPHSRRAAASAFTQRCLSGKQSALSKSPAI